MRSASPRNVRPNSRWTFAHGAQWVVGLIVLAVLAIGGCRSTYDAAYYNTMEAFGKEKRDILVNRIENARSAQEDAKEEFSSALEAFQSVTGYEGGELEEAYDRLNGAYEDSKGQAEDVRERIDNVERVAEDLFEEWEKELTEYEDPKLRRLSEDKLRQTRTRYERLLRAMHRAEDRMDPVLEAFQDQVLFLKHNLNARAIASLEDTLDELETDVEGLIADMEASIDEASQFLEQLRQEAEA